MQFQSRRRLEIRWIIEQDPLMDRYRKRSAGDQIVVKLAETKGGTFRVAITTEESHDLPFAGDVADLLRRIDGCAGRFAGRRFAIESAAFHEVFDRLIERPFAAVQIHIDTDARGAITSQAQDLSCG